MPYPNGEAIGLAFAVNRHSKIPASLRVIKEEIEKSSNTPTGRDRINETYWKTLTHWTEQGIFLLNAALTVARKNAGSHLGIWQWFTREVIKIISKNNTCIWMLWGAKAQDFRDFILESHPILNTNYDWSNLDYSKNFILQAPHPAAELYGGKQKFSGCNHFNLCNEILKIQNKQLINW